jgi:glycosyltransferase involved in cell wall biosynthesis
MFKKRAGIFIYYEWLSVSSSLISAIRFLTENGYSVDVFHLYDDTIDIFKPESDKVNSIAVKSGKKKWLTLILFFIASIKGVIKNKYSFFIGVDQEGIIAAGLLGKIKKVPYIYYSLEIITKEDVLKEKGIRRFVLKIRKSLENYFSKNAQITITQDSYRTDVLVEDNNIKRERVFIVPNSYYFTLQRPCNYNNFNFQIPTDKKTIIYTGSIIPEMAIEEIINSMDLWPENTVLILHTPYKTVYLEEIRQLIKKKNIEKRAIVSTGQVSFEELCCLIKKADIGISFYRPINKSFALGPAGKVSFYLSQGLPIITNKIPSVMDLVKKYRCGICVDMVREMGDAIRTILENYSEFSVNTKICYENELEFSKYFKKVLKQIESYEK